MISKNILTSCDPLSTFMEFLLKTYYLISCEFCKIKIDFTIFQNYLFGKSMGNTESTMNSILTNEVVKSKEPAIAEVVESVIKNETLDQVHRSNDKLKEPAIAEVDENLDLDLDQVHTSTDKLVHPAAERAKAPKRRLPSSVSMFFFLYICI